MITLYNDRKEPLMNKTVKIILQVISYVISALLGAGGTYTLMQ